MASTELRRELEARLVPYAESLGFVPDRRKEPRILCFRKRTATSIRLFAVLWEPRGKPEFLIEFAEAPLEGVTRYRDHIAAEDLLPGNTLLLRGELVPERGKMWFRLPRSWLHARGGRDEIVLVQQVLDLFPEVIAWWESKAEGPHLLVFEPKKIPAFPPFTPVSGVTPTEPSLLQRYFAGKAAWPIQFIGLAVVFDLFYARNAWDRANIVVVPMVLLMGAAIGFGISWFANVFLWRIRARVNGGPFHTGDIVQVIAGPCAGRVGSVYEEWPTRNQVRVDLGDSEMREVKDVFSHVELMKCRQDQRYPSVGPAT